MTNPTRTQMLVLCLLAAWAAVAEDAAPAAAPVPREEPRPAAWAVPVRLAGVPNFFKVSESLYRGAQPTAEGMQNLSRMGIRTVVNLRSFHTDTDEIGAAGLRAEHIFMKAWHAEEEDILRFLRIATDTNRAPVLVHCQHGSDRTGTMCAIYRMAVQGWTKEEALRELQQGGFGFHEVWQNLVAYVRALDVDALRRKAGLTAPAAPGGPPAPAAAPPRTTN